MRRKFRKTIACATLLAAFNLFGAEPSMVDGRINVAFDDLKPPFIRSVRFYPGEVVDISVSFKVDAMRWMYEERMCWSEWFGGIDCHYVDRSRGSGIDATQAPLIATLLDGQGNQIPASAVKPALSSDPTFDETPHLVVAGDVMTFELLLADADVDRAFAQGYTPSARVSKRVGKPGALNAIDRHPCAPQNNNHYCSQGEYVISIRRVDVSQRMKKLEAFLARPRTFAEIGSDDVLDQWLLNDIDSNHLVPSAQRRESLAKSLLKHVKQYYAAKPGDPGLEDRGNILLKARSLSPDDYDVAAAIVETNLASGNIAQAKAENESTLKDLHEKYRKGNKSREILRGYAEALRNAGNIRMQLRGGAPDPGDTEMAASLYAQANSMWREYDQLDGLNDGDREVGRSGLVQTLVDQARVLRMLGDRDAMRRAIAALELAKSSLPRDRAIAIVSAEPATGHLIGVEPLRPQSPSDVPVRVGFLAADTSEIVTEDASTGAVLVRTKTGRYELIRRAGASVRLPFTRHLREARLGEKCVVGLLEKEADPGAELVRVSDNKIDTVYDDPSLFWDVAWGSCKIAVVTRGSADAFTLIDGASTQSFSAGPGEFEALALSRDGKFVATIQAADGARTLYISDLTSVDFKKSTKNLVLSGDTKVTQIGFTPGDDFVVMTDDHSLMVVPSDASRTVDVHSQGASFRFLPISDHKIALPQVEGGILKSILIADVAAVKAGSVEAQPDDAIRTQSLPFKVVSDRSAVLGAERDGVVQVEIAATSVSPGDDTSFPRLTAFSEHGSRLGSAIVVEDWRPDRTVEVGTLVGVNPTLGRTAQLFDRATGALRATFSDTAGVVEIVPIGSEEDGLFCTITKADSGAISQIEVRSAANPEVVKSSWSPQTEPPSEVSGREWTWRLFATRKAPLTNSAWRAYLLGYIDGSSAEPPGLTRDDYDKRYASRIPGVARLVTITEKGAVESMGVSQRGAEDVVGIVGGAFIEKRETGLAVADEDGKLAYFSECDETVTKCGRTEIFEPLLGAPLSIRRRDDSVEVATWKIEGSGISRVATCLMCDKFHMDDAFEATGKLSVSPEFAGVGVGTKASALLVSVPVGGRVMVGAVDASTWARKYPIGRPIWADSEMVVLQRDVNNAQIWEDAPVEGMP